MTAWVVDVMIVSPETMFENIMKMLEEEFLLKRGPLLSKGGSRYLGREWRRIGDEVQIRIDPKHFMENIEIGGMTSFKSVCTPEAVSHHSTDGSPLLSKEEHENYRRIIGRFFYNVDVRIDLLTAVRECASACAAPTLIDKERAKIVL